MKSSTELHHLYDPPVANLHRLLKRGIDLVSEDVKKERRDPFTVLTETGFIGSAEGPSDLLRSPSRKDSRAYVEICFVRGAMEIDENDVGTSTAGGDCGPGDRGWVIERDEQPSLHWSAAKAECLKHGMRLPELFEQQVTCREAEVIGIVDMTDDWEWVSNTARPLILFEPLTQGNIVPAQGGGGDCEHESALWTSHEESTGTVQNFRCAS